MAEKSRAVTDLTDDEILVCCNVLKGRPEVYNDAVVALAVEGISKNAKRGTSLLRGHDSRGLKIQIKGADNLVATPGTMAAVLETERSRAAGGALLPLPSKSTVTRAQKRISETPGVKIRKADVKELRRLEVLRSGYTFVSLAAVLVAMGVLIDASDLVDLSFERILHELTFNYDETSFYINNETGSVEVFVTSEDVAHLSSKHQSVSTAKNVGGADQKRCIKMGNVTSRDGKMPMVLFEIKDSSFRTGVDIVEVSSVLCCMCCLLFIAILTPFFFIYFCRSATLLEDARSGS